MASQPRLALASGFAGDGNGTSRQRGEQASHLYLVGYNGNPSIIRLEGLARAAVKDSYKMTLHISGFPFQRDAAKSLCPELVGASEFYLAVIRAELQGETPLLAVGDSPLRCQSSGLAYSRDDELQSIKDKANRIMKTFYESSAKTYPGIGYGKLELQALS